MTKPEYDYTHMKALVIDDQMFIRRIIGNMLRQMGFKEVMEASDGADGLKLTQTLRPNIIICDIEMEPVDGLTFLKILRTAKDVINHNVPVVFLTSHTDSDIVQRARALKVNAFVVKPPSLTALAERISYVLFRQHETPKAG